MKSMRMYHKSLFLFLLTVLLAACQTTIPSPTAASQKSTEKPVAKQTSLPPTSNTIPTETPTLTSSPSPAPTITETASSTTVPTEKVTGVVVIFTAPMYLVCQVYQTSYSDSLTVGPECKAKVPSNNTLWGRITRLDLMRPAGPGEKLLMPKGAILAKSVSVKGDRFGLTPDNKPDTTQVGAIQVFLDNKEVLLVIPFEVTGPQATVFVSPTP
jgi:hypothetical protein